ncbi:MAG: histone deacetylase family protein [Roseibacillus sp.]|nr:histone deacetylase family protein [Roseibacillus sp.]
MLTFFTHPAYNEHRMHEGHPERPERTQSILSHLRETGQLTEFEQRNPETVSEEALKRVHEPLYLKNLAASAPASGLVTVDPDTHLAPGSLPAARLAAGALEEAVALVLSGKSNRVFSCARPPGHHAEHDAGMGFCFYNNVAVGAAAALAHEDIDRVAILDFDVHHGNGTVDIFKDKPGVLVASSFQHPHYPHRYYDLKRPNIVNTPLVAGTDGPGFRKAIERDWLPALEKFKPQLIFISAGFDAHTADPLGDIHLKEADFTWVTDLIVAAARQHCGGRIISTLEGGYNLEALARSVAAHLQALAS